MRTALLLLSFLTAVTVQASAQAPAKPQPAPPPATTAKPPAQPAPGTAKPPAQPPAGTTKPATAGPAPARRPAQPAARGGMAITVTGPSGATLPSIAVGVTGVAERAGETNDSGQLNFPGLPAGTYRVRFSGADVVTFEREVTLRAGQIADLDIMLNPAPPPKVVTVDAPAPPPPAAEAPAMGPAGSPLALSLYDMAERELSAKQPRREMLVSCSGNLRSTLVLLTTQDQPQRLYENAEVTYYVLGGQANIRIGDKDNNLAAGGFVSVPRGTPFTVARRGRGALSLLSLLSGEPCEEAR